MTSTAWHCLFSDAYGIPLPPPSFGCRPRHGAAAELSARDPRRRFRVNWMILVVNEIFNYFRVTPPAEVVVRALGGGGAGAAWLPGEGGMGG